MRIAIIAGSGDLPRVIAEHQAAIGNTVFIAGLKGFAGSWIGRFNHTVLGLGEIGRLFEELKSNGVETLTFAGNVSRPDFRKLKPDWRGVRLLPRVLAAAAKGDDALLRAIVEIVEAEGFQVIGAHEMLESLKANVGWMTGKAMCSEEGCRDIARAWTVAGVIGEQDIGQGAVVCRGVVLAVEAQEGTDAMLERVASLPENVRGTVDERRGVLCKRLKPVQERRIDMPVIGISTVRNAASAGLAGIAIEGNNTLVIDAEGVVSAASEAGLFLVALGQDGALP